MMATSTRPPLRAAAEQRRARLTKSPPAMTDEVENHAHAHAHAQNAISVSVSVSHSTRRSSRTTPLHALDDDRDCDRDRDRRSPKPASKPVTQHAPRSSPKPPSNSRKRPATALIADATTPDTRPPTKVTVTQPHGQLLSTTNGVSRPLAIAHDDIPSGLSTPTGAGGAIAGGLAVPTPASAQSASTQTSDKRSLRSHDGGSRLKSDLPTYFSNYDDIIAGVPTPPELLAVDTPIYIVDEPLKVTKSPTAPASEEPSRLSASPSRSRKFKAHSPSRRASYVPVPPSQSSTTYQTLEYGSIIGHVRNYDDQDPLADSVYVVQHRRAERKEKQLRNIEKERAMHEKVQLERLLDGLQGHDWLKVMGITGVTDGERKDWEPKRDYFVKEVKILVDKFRIWKEEEKRLRAEKDAALALASREDDEDDEEEEAYDPDVPNPHDTEPSTAERHREKEPQIPKPRRLPRPHGYILPPPPPEPLPPFTSFYAKPHLRAAALGKHRHGRNASAFGQPIPEFEEHEFDLPEDYLTYEFLRDHARKRRRQKRESGVNP